MFKCFNHDHNPSPVVFAVKLLKPVKTHLSPGGDIAEIPAGTIGYVDFAYEYDEVPDVYCYECNFFRQKNFTPPKDYVNISAWCYGDEIESLEFKNLYALMFEDE